MPEKDLILDESQKAYSIQAVKYQLEFGEQGEDIVRMITQYIAQGWMDWGQATLMLKAVFEPDICDDGKEAQHE